MHKCVLLPLDGSIMAEQALPYAVAQAQRFRSELILLRAVGSLNGNGQSPVELSWVQDLMGQWARDYLESIATQVRVEGVPVKVVVLHDPPHEAITQFAEANSVDLIVICSRGQSGPSRWLMGSVADRVVRGATAPVLLVRASEQKSTGKANRESQGR
ncbi:MAG: universal stress protein [Anaerolineae bacterium]|jgi:nucleotide-binding universal stress UspA family protein